MLEIAFNGEVTPNKKLKHEIDGANGWYHYESRFGLSVYSENGEVERYNVFHVYMIVRHDKNGRKYLYDIINIKKRNEHPALAIAIRYKTHFLLNNVQKTIAFVNKKIKLFKMYRLPAALLYKAGAANRRATFNARTNH